MAEAEACSECGQAISGGLIPRRVRGRVLCPACDQERIRRLNRKDQVPLLLVLILYHAAVAVLIILAALQGVFRWLGTHRIQPEQAELLPLLLSLSLFPLGLAVAWITWNLWKLETRGRLFAILFDGLLGILSGYWLLQGDRFALAGVAALFGCWYLCRSPTADRFW